MFRKTRQHDQRQIHRAVSAQKVRECATGSPRLKPAKGSCDDRLPHPLGSPQAQADDPERIAIREALAFGKAVYDQRCALGLSISDLARRAGMTIDEIECIEEGPGL